MTFNDDPPERRVFFEHRYSYRQPLAYFLAMLLGMAGAIMLVSVTWQLWSGKFKSLFPGLLFVVGWLLFAWVPALYLGWRIFFSPYCISRIDAYGITIDGHTVPWDGIEYVGGERSRGWLKPKITPYYHPRSASRLKAIRWIPAELSQEKYGELMNELTQYLATAFPHVTVN